MLVLTVVNAQWLADVPKGAVKLVAQSGLGPADGCEGGEPYHRIEPNSAESIVRADALGAGMVAVPVVADTDGTALLALADECIGEQAETLAGLVPQLGKNARLLVQLPDGAPDVAQAALAAFAEAGRDPIEARDAFYGDADSLAPIRERFPEAWAWNEEEARACSRDYVLMGWSGYLPGSCRGRTMLVPLGSQWQYWGWPNRLLARMEAHGGKVVMAVSGDGPLATRGIDLPEQLGEVPSTFNGYLWVDDAFAILPALYPRFDRRRQAEIDATRAAIQKRRASR